MADDRSNPPFTAYRGGDPYAFICYAHTDAHHVYPIINLLNEHGYNIWYDEGISPGQQWREELANAIDQCALFILFVSNKAVNSPDCRKEINFAIAQNKPILSIHLAETKLPPGLDLAMSDVQALLRFKFSGREFERKLLSTMARIFTDGEALETHYPPKSANKKVWFSSLHLIALALAVLVVALALSFISWQSEPSKPVTIAVLSFDNFSADVNNDFIAAGIAEEIINLLEKISSLRVVGRKASFYYKDKDVDFQTIARRLRADVLLEGSIRREDNHLRVTAQLIDGDTAIHRWSGLIDKDIGDLFSTQSDIARQVVDDLRIELTGDELAQLERKPTQDVKAYAIYLEAKNYHRIASTRTDLENARGLFQRAIKRDPKFVEAQSGLCITEVAFYQRSLSTSDYNRASATCARISGQSKSPVEVRMAIGTLNLLVGNYAQALQLFDDILRENPGHEPANHGRASSLDALQRFPEAEAAYLKSIELQPGYWQTYSEYGIFLAMTGRIQESIVQFREVLKLTPDNPLGYNNLGTALFSAGLWQETESVWRISLDIEASSAGFENLAAVQYFKGQFADASATIRTGLDQFPDNFRLWGRLGAVRAALNDADGAEQAINRAIELVEPLLSVNLNDPYARAFLCVYRVRAGMVEDGLSLCRTALELSPNDPEINYLYGTALQLAEQSAAARKNVNRAIELGYGEKMYANDPVFNPR